MRPPGGGGESDLGRRGPRQGRHGVLFLDSRIGRSASRTVSNRTAGAVPGRRSTSRGPIILFAAGTGVAPYRAFIQARARASSSAKCWLFLSLALAGRVSPWLGVQGPSRSGRSPAGRRLHPRGAGTCCWNQSADSLRFPDRNAEFRTLSREDGVGRELFQLIQTKEEGGAGRQHLCVRPERLCVHRRRNAEPRVRADHPDRATVAVQERSGGCCDACRGKIDWSSSSIPTRDRSSMSLDGSPYRRSHNATARRPATG